MGRNIGGAYNTANEWSVPPMPATVSVPHSLSSLLHRFRSCFTAPGYEVFTAMFTGFFLRPVERTVCGMLTGAGLAGSGTIPAPTDSSPEPAGTCSRSA